MLEVLLSPARCADVGSFSYGDGGEFPGARGNVSCWPARNAVRVSYDLGEGGRYVALQHSSPQLIAATSGPDSPTALMMDVLAEWGAAGGGCGVKLFDSTGQSFETRAALDVIPGGAITPVSLPLDNATFRSAGGGTADGVIHFPLVGIMLTAFGGSNGSVGLNDLALAFQGGATIPAAAAVTVQLSTDPPLGVAAVGDSLGLILSVTNRVRDVPTPPLTTWIETTPLAGDGWPSHTPATLLPNETAAVVVPGWGVYTRTTSVPTARPGFVALAAGCSGEGASLAAARSGLVIRPTLAAVAPAAPPPWANTGLFGSQRFTTSEQIAAAARLGVRAVRFSPRWGSTVSSSTGQITFANYDEEYAAVRAAGLDILLDVLVYPPPWAASPNHSGVPRADPAVMANLSAFAAAAITHFRDGLVGVSVDNEPDNNLVWIDKIPLDEAARLYGLWLAAVMTEAAVVAPGLPAGGLPVSGGAWGHTNLSLAKAVLAQPGVAPCFSLFTGHPYERDSHKGVSTAGLWTYPSEDDGSPTGGGTLVGKLFAARDVLADTGVANASLWPSEFGWTLERNASVDSALAVAHAAAVTQGLVLLRSLPPPQFGRFFLFAGWEFGYEMEDMSFNLFRDPTTVFLQSYRFASSAGGYPLPAAAAYGTAAAFLDLPTVGQAPAQPLGDGAIIAATFRRPSASTSSATIPMAIVAAWTPPPAVKDPAWFLRRCFRLALPLSVSTFTGLGEPVDKSVGVWLSPMPTYFVAPDESDTAIAAIVSALSACAHSSSACACGNTSAAA